LGRWRKSTPGFATSSASTPSSPSCTPRASTTAHPTTASSSMPSKTPTTTGRELRPSRFHESVARLHPASRHSRATDHLGRPCGQGAHTQRHPERPRCPRPPAGCGNRGRRAHRRRRPPPRPLLRSFRMNQSSLARSRSALLASTDHLAHAARLLAGAPPDYREVLRHTLQTLRQAYTALLTAHHLPVHPEAPLDAL